MRRRTGVLIALVGVAAASCLALLSQPAVTSAGASSDWAAVLAVCADGQELEAVQECLTREWLLAADSHTLEGVTRAVRELSQTSDVVGRVCHEAAHQAGQRAVAGHPEWTADLLRVEAEPDEPCASGFQHGVLEGVGRLAPDEPLEVARAKCYEFELVDQAVGDSCAHGLGHGVWLHEGALDDSWEACAAGDDAAGQRVREFCLGGVLMLMAQQDTRWPAELGSVQSRELTRDLFDACTSLPGATARVLDQCPEWAALPAGTHAAAQVASVVHGNASRAEAVSTLEGAVDSCRVLPGNAGQECIAAVANAVGSTAQARPEDVTTVCALVPEAHRSECVAAARPELTRTGTN